MALNAPSLQRPAGVPDGAAPHWLSSAADAPKAGAAGHDYERHFRSAGRPELLNRLGDNIVVFQPIHDQDIRRRILAKKRQPLVEHLRERWGIALRISDQVVDRLVELARADHGGRGLLNAVERELLNPLARFLFEHHAKLLVA